MRLFSIDLNKSSIERKSEEDKFENEIGRFLGHRIAFQDDISCDQQDERDSVWTTIETKGVEVCVPRDTKRTDAMFRAAFEHERDRDFLFETSKRKTEKYKNSEEIDKKFRVETG